MCLNNNCNDKSCVGIYMIMKEYQWFKMAVSINAPTDFICNELLSNVQFYRNRATHDKIKKIILNFYIADEITSAKNTAWNYCVTFIGDKLIRRDSFVRLRQDADIEDIIISAFKKAEENNVKLPTLWC